MVGSLSKPVQNLLVNSGGELPEKYIYKGEDGAIDTNFPQIDVPVIDLSLLSSSSPTGEQEKELTKLRSAFSTCGCF